MRAKLSNPRVSVLMPVYNGKRFLESAIQSVQAQTFADWQLIVVDDGSRDASADIVNRLAAADNRISLIRQPNGGVAAARSSALRAADTPYVALLDQDDIWHPHKLACQVAALDAHPNVVLSHAEVDFIDALGAGTSGINMVKIGQFAGHATNDMLRGNGVAALTVLCRTDALRRSGGFTQAEAPADDWGAWLRLSLMGDFAFSSQSLGAYRVHDTNETHKRLKMRIAEQVVLRNFSKAYLPHLDFGSRAILKWKMAEVAGATASQLALDGQRQRAQVMRVKAAAGKLLSPLHCMHAAFRYLPSRSRTAMEWWMFKYLGLR